MADQEVMGSRREWETPKQFFGERLYVGDAPSDAPNTGDFFQPSGGSAESGLTGRRCISVQMDKEVVPGIFFFKATYMAFRAYA